MRTKSFFWLFAVTFSILFIWLVQVDTIELYQRYWPGAATMVAGSFVAGSTPLGGGAVAFPVFSKLLGASAVDARSFGFLIQAVGMSFATLFFILNRIEINWKWILQGIPFAIAGLFTGLIVLPASDVMTKWLYSLFAVSSGVVLLRLQFNTRFLAAAREPALLAMAVITFFGGVLSSQVGAGADTLLFFFLVLACHQNPKVVIPTTVSFMSLIAIAGSLLLLLAKPEALTDFVVNNWLVAAPVVAIGAPLGGWVMSKISLPKLVIFLKFILLVEASSTLLLVDLPLLYRGLLMSVILAGLYVFISSLKQAKQV